MDVRNMKIYELHNILEEIDRYYQIHRMIPEYDFCFVNCCIRDKMLKSRIEECIEIVAEPFNKRAYKKLAWQEFDKVDIKKIELLILYYERMDRILKMLNYAKQHRYKGEAVYIYPVKNKNKTVGYSAIYMYSCKEIACVRTNANIDTKLLFYKCLFAVFDKFKKLQIYPVIYLSSKNLMQAIKKKNVEKYYNSLDENQKKSFRPLMYGIDTDKIPVNIVLWQDSFTMTKPEKMYGESGNGTIIDQERDIEKLIQEQETEREIDYEY